MISFSSRIGLSIRSIKILATSFAPVTAGRLAQLFFNWSRSVCDANLLALWVIWDKLLCSTVSAIWLSPAHAALPAWLSIPLIFGINKVGEITNRTPNYGFGLNLWINPSFGLRLQTVGKYGIIQNTLMNNHIQHSAELVLKF